MWSNEEKNRFRQRKVWEEFAQSMWDSLPVINGHKRCQLLGTKLNKKTAQVHHLYPEHYDLLDPTSFKVLSPTAHDLVEHLAKVIHGNASVVPNLDKLMNWIGDFLPAPEGNLKAIYEDMERIKKESKGQLT